MTNDEDRIPELERKSERVYDLGERTARFGEAVIDFARNVPQNCVTVPLITQLVRAGTNVGANYCEADDAISKKDFRHKISICKKESRETMFWCRMIARAVGEMKRDARVLWKESHELHLIFAKIWRAK
jgi:four helix bundle protein